ncbi:MULTISPECIES: helix-turn-helix domain-containing protein [unclassified Mycolicibacterium]|uniref:helix-turn-helix domain-containing protein n=1 Tax=unclassified Mycolicibacterium TaxID=2636767 RepID=UPI0012DE1321|nr:MULTISPECIES: helix-turn-helix domain-containing protein [unclassified Mycolicibacterium]MUL82116.1 helix-turn-helix domain-containing protein [Mycolicibacterium sp. CBMA 329]MUL87882.1 helix-turn-helix domain-containing protein [Mycolicibacterium sp. CBMA 331]MUM01705.1 helix-turn-helix domain-containing protein [Mycolicibacterium sp. CBMA 334]MUM28439.1 helix-turn-helix domain-containing protein [Mycolicibacterium sp. CBMA 295]MUM38179.1 helix-turn-helix domain-containing protein [Mycolic
MSSSSSTDGYVGAAVRDARREAGLTLRALADRLNVSAATVSAIENGKTGVSVTRLRAVAELLGVPIERLLPVDSPPDPHPDAEPRRGSSGVISGGDWRDFPPLTLDPVLRAAVDAFVEIGYHGASMRMLAERAQLSVSGIYHHYRDKQELLVRILDITMAELHWRVEAARREARTSVEEVALTVEALALFHTNRAQLAFIGASEMRSLTGANRRRIAVSRSRLQHLLDDAIARASAEGYLHPVSAPTAGRAIATMCTSLPQWFRPDGPDTAEQVARTYVEFALTLLRPQKDTPSE